MTDYEWDEVINLAKSRGCHPENDCWQDCMDLAFESLGRHR